MPTMKPLYHWDTELQTLVPIPQGGERKRQPDINENAFRLIHKLHETHPDVRDIHIATSWSEWVIYEVLKQPTYEAFLAARVEFNKTRAARREQQRTQALQTEATDLAIEAEAAMTELVPVMEAAPLSDDALTRIINALEGIDVSLKGIREDTRQSLELTQKLYDLWKPVSPQE